MITEKEALELLERTFTKEKKGIAIHSKGVAEIAFEIAKKIKDNNPELDLNPQKIKVAAILHDLGKSKEGPHELNTIKILKEKGLDELATLVMHGFAYERSLIKGIINKELQPKSLSNKIVAYADMFFSQKRVSFKERIADIRSRRGKDPNLEKVLALAIPRVKILKEEIESLID